MTDNFVCDDCGSVDNIFATPQTGVGFKCSECLNGQWHNQFPKETWDKYAHGPVLNRRDEIDVSFS